MLKNLEMFGIVPQKPEIAPECCSAPSSSYKINTRKFDLYADTLESVVKRGIGPVHCVIIRSKSEQPGTIASILDLCPLHPTGSAWVCVREERDRDGALTLWPERLTSQMRDTGWYLADKVYWRVGKTPPGILIGSKKDRKYLGSCGVSLRFTRDVPNKTWTGPDELKETDSCWERTFTENASWYTRQIAFTCPEDGIVLDPLCRNGFVAEAALLMGRQFVGVNDDVTEARSRITDIVQDLGKC